MNWLRACLPVVIIACFGGIASATWQIADQLKYGGHDYVMFQAPMVGLWHFEEGKVPPGKLAPPEFEVQSSANWSGYEAVWEIRDSQLFLNSIAGRVKGKQLKNEQLLSKTKFPTVATWFTGKVHLAVGDYDDETGDYEAVIVFEIEKGKIKSMTFAPISPIKYSWNGL